MRSSVGTGDRVRSDFVAQYSVDRLDHGIVSGIVEHCLRRVDLAEYDYLFGAASHSTFRYPSATVGLSLDSCSVK